jgi:DNA recombination protein RmuC
MPPELLERLDAVALHPYAMPVLLLLVLVVALLAWRGTRRAAGGERVEAARIAAEQAREATRSEADRVRGTVADTERALRDLLATLTTEAAERGGTLQADVARALAGLRDAQFAEQTRLRDLLDRKAEEGRAQIETKLREMREANEAKLLQIEKAVNERLTAAVEKQMTESFGRVIDQFAAVQKAMGEVQAVTQQVGDLKRLFGNVKTRGGWGETQVKALLDDILPPGSYEQNRKLREDSNDVVEFALVLPARGERTYLAVDAKFPVEDYERLLAAAEIGDAEAERAARTALERRIRTEAQKIASKYIAPPLTVEYAVLYLPTDSLYAEVARIPGLLDTLGRDQRVMVLGPSLLPAMLRTIQLGYVTLALEQKSGEIRTLLGATKGEMEKMAMVLDRLAKQAETFGRTIGQAQVRTRAVTRKLRGVGTLGPADAEAVLELEAPEPEEE